MEKKQDTVVSNTPVQLFVIPVYDSVTKRIHVIMAACLFLSQEIVENETRTFF